MKILITGSNGQLGNEIRSLAGAYSHHEFIYTDVNELDITNAENVNQFFAFHNPDVVINCAAYTAVDKAETDKDAAYLVNAIAPGNLALAASDSGAFMVHVSTDYVYEGKNYRPYVETDKLSPVSVYAKSKVAGEEAVQQAEGKAVIIRTSWLYSAFGNNFVKTMVRLGTEKTELGVIADQIGSPTNAADLAHAILTIISSVEYGSKPFVPGIYHYSNEGVASWYDFTKAIFEIAGINCFVKPIASEDYPSPVQRPPYSVMNKSKIKLIFGLQIPHWRDSLTEYFQKK